MTLDLCLVAFSQVIRTKIRTLANSRTKINKGIRKSCIVKSQGLAQFPIQIEGKTATILTRVIKDEGRPLGMQLSIGNNHLTQQETVIDNREMVLYMNMDTEDRVAVPFSVGELLFLHKKFQVRANQDFSCPADSSGMIRVQIFANELPFFFEQPTLLYMEQTNMSAISIPRAILRLDQQSTATRIVVNISGHPVQIVEGEILGDATLCLIRIIKLSKIQIPIHFQT